ncbi:hypothetical protein B0H17DRAFT_1067252 [Mycena rosella]|uniref:F-box domain-containing protein n=1 Tax=Mycena rosella TaxID=1033263 RepID=A0AAD7DE88_MYCRO|nr:hypothetical protein B0H17DRAFT_1067252 [Mycena rosella]
MAQTGAVDDMPSPPTSLGNPSAHRLPPELLAEIFGMCSSPAGEDSTYGGLSDKLTPEQEVERLAKAYLLQLSQVCSVWHEVAMGTPKLWSTIVVDTTLWYSARTPEQKLVDLVASSLERGRSHPLVIEVALDDDYAYVMALLSQHAPRWRNVYIWHSLPSFPWMAAAKGNLPLLESLELSHQNDEWTEQDILAVAPRLKTFVFSGWAAKTPAVPWQQLRYFIYTNIQENDLVDTLALLQRLGPRARCKLSVDVVDLVHPIDLPPIVSDISGLSITFTVNFVHQDQIDVVGAVLESLTLPCLTMLELVNQSDEPPISWHQQHFLSFAARSSLHATLTALEICALIEDVELAACLAFLPLLEHLTVSDCQDEAHAVLTDTLLSRLVRSSGLVPRLNFFCMTSLLQFSDAVYWAFVDSRLTSDPASLVFEIHTYWLPARTRALSEEFLARGYELEARRELVFTAAPDPDYNAQSYLPFFLS